MLLPKRRGSSVDIDINNDGAQISVIDVNAGLDQQHKLRTLLDQCSSCNMFELPRSYHECLHSQYLKGFPVTPPIICEKCRLISEQEGAIQLLNNQIHELTATVKQLRDIRSIEKEIDLSLVGTHDWGDYRQDQTIPDESTLIPSGTDASSSNEESNTNINVDSAVRRNTMI